MIHVDSSCNVCANTTLLFDIPVYGITEHLCSLDCITTAIAVYRPNTLVDRMRARVKRLARHVLFGHRHKG